MISETVKKAIFESARRRGLYWRHEDDHEDLLYKLLVDVANDKVENEYIDPVTETSSDALSQGKSPLIKGVMYWPRKSPSQDMWRELRLGTITWADIDADLDQMKAVLGVNAIRVFTFYDHEFRNERSILTAGGMSLVAAEAQLRSQNVGMTDGKGWFNDLYLGYIRDFIDRCAARGLDVIVTTLQELPALLSTDNWNFLETDLGHYRSFMRWLMGGLADKPNLPMVILKNEPDGYAVWNNNVLAGRVLKFLSILKGEIKDVLGSRMPVCINTVSADNIFKRFAEVDKDIPNSVYQLTDIVAQNSFLWADNGTSGSLGNYRVQFDYVRANNYLGKPMVMTECGFPANYAQQEVLGSPLLNEDGSPAGGNAAFTRSSIVPQGGIFDRPKGVGLAQTPENQRVSVAEAFYWAERYGFVGGLVWSAYDHRNDTAPFVYRDAFGVIDRNGVPLPAAEEVFNAFGGIYKSDGRRHLSLIQGTANNGRINGLGGYNSGAPADNTMNGVFLTGSAGAWTSDELYVDPPWRIRLTLNLRATYPANSEPFTIFMQTAGGGVIQWRYKDYGSPAYQQIIPGAETDYGFAQPIAAVAANAPFTVDIDFTSLSPKLYHNGVLMNVVPASSGPAAGQVFSYANWQLDWVKIGVISQSVALDIRSAALVGPAGGILNVSGRSKRVGKTLADLEIEVARIKYLLKAQGIVAR